MVARVRRAAGALRWNRMDWNGLRWNGPGWNRLHWGRRRALRSAQVLDDVVDAQLGLVPSLPEDLKQRTVDHLVELVQLSRSYRAHAAGRISRRELRRRGQVALVRLESFTRPRMQQLTERE